MIKQYSIHFTTCIHPTRLPLEDHTFGLLALLLLQLPHVDIPPHPNRRHTQRHEARARNDHEPLYMCIRAHNGIALGRAIRETHLRDNVAKDLQRTIFGVFWQSVIQLLWQRASPQRTGNRIPNGRPKPTE